MASPIFERQGFGTPKGRQPGARMQHFALSGKRGETAPALVDYILLAEFDIDSGRWGRVAVLAFSWSRCAPPVLVEMVEQTV